MRGVFIILFKRNLQSEVNVELTRTNPVDLNVVFKQYDTLTSTLVVKTTFNGTPTVFTNETVYMVYKVQEKPYGNPLEITKNGTPIKDVATYSEEEVGLITVNIDPEVLTYSGDIKCELVIVSSDNTMRFTSPTMSFKIEPSLVGNSQ